MLTLTLCALFRLTRSHIKLHRLTMRLSTARRALSSALNDKRVNTACVDTKLLDVELLLQSSFFTPFFKKLIKKEYD